MSIGTASLASLFESELRNENGVTSLYCHLDPANVIAAAKVVAQGIAKRRLGVNDRLYAVWFEAANRLTLPSVNDKKLLVASLLQNIGTREEPESLDHLHGLVAEEIWLEVVRETDLGLGIPVRVEDHHWSVTDPGGDGLTVHSLKMGGFCFRLWESKFHGTEDPIRGTVGQACRQIKDRAPSYLARFSLVARCITDDPQLATFYGRLSEMWVNRDPAAGASVVVAASATEETDCFQAIPEYFELGADCHQGQLNTAVDFPSFALLVRDVLWKGCG